MIYLLYGIFLGVLLTIGFLVIAGLIVKEKIIQKMNANDSQIFETDVSAESIRLLRKFKEKYNVK